MHKTDHQQLQNEIPAFLAGRLRGEASAALEKHIDCCQSCSAIVEAWIPAVEGFRLAGAALLEPHPDSLELLRYARGEGSPDARLSRHLETCPTCLLEVEGGQAGTARPVVSRPGGRLTRYVSLALAAGLVLGIGLTTLVRDPGSGMQGAAGPTQLYTLEEAVRSGTGGTVIDVEPGSTVLPLVLLPAVPENTPPEALFRIDIRGERGETVWSETFTAADLNRYIEVSGVLTLLVPALPEGGYVVELLSAEGSDDAPLQEYRFQVRQR